MNTQKHPEGRWVLKTQNEEIVAQFTEYLADYFKPRLKKPVVTPDETRTALFTLLARLFYNRGFREDGNIADFFNVTPSRLHDPFMLPDMEKAVERIKKAIENKEKITIYGDYDVDGITSVSILYKYLISEGADVDYYIPGRTEEGYGLNEQALDKIRETGTSLLITVDTGTTALEESVYAKKIGMDLVITDHHECKLTQNDDGTATEQIPKCIAVVNPKRPSGNYPFADLAGVGVVFKLLCALTEDIEKMFDLYGDLTAIGTIADIMPLVNENRVLVVTGIKKIREHGSVGIKALLSAAGNEKDISSSVIAYTVAPRLNAAGRIGDPKTSISLLLEKDYAKAMEIANLLCDENRKRQALESEIYKDVEAMIGEGVPNDKILVFASDNWHHGVIGIVASRLIERHSRPCILLCGDGENMKGSARSIKGISIFELLQHVSGTLLKFGGHEMAAGLTLSRDKYDEFKRSITEYSNENITDKMLIPVIEAECELPFESLTLRTHDAVRMLEPFGTGNPTPLFIVKNLKVTEIESIGAGRHVKMRVCKLDAPSEPITTLMFNTEYNLLNCAKGDEIDMICSLGENVFNKSRSLTINVKKIKLSTNIESKDKVQKLFYDNFKKNGRTVVDILITRDIVGAVYKYIRKHSTAPVEEYNAYAYARRLSAEAGVEIGYGQLMLSLDVLSELKLIEYTGSETVKIKCGNNFTKVDLQSSETWGKVH